MANSRLLAVLLTAFGGLAILLAGVGVYGVMSYSLSQRTRELGVRMALGAEARDVLGMVLRHGVGLASIGIGLGLVAAFGLSRFLGSMLYGISPTDPVTLAGISIFMLLVVLAACYIPARRATRIDPMTALRFE